jgi:hypothetical protein
MRRALAYTLFTILIAATACGGGSNGPTAPPGGSGPGTMTAQVNGSAWTATVVKRAFVNSGLVTIQGSDGSRIITIVARASAAGAYSLAVGNGIGHNALYTVISPAANWSTALTGGTGTITITAISATNVSGTFIFTATSSVSGTAPAQITAGQFNLPLS